MKNEQDHSAKTLRLHNLASYATHARQAEVRLQVCVCVCVCVCTCYPVQHSAIDNHTCSCVRLVGIFSVSPVVQSSSPVQ